MKEEKIIKQYYDNKLISKHSFMCPLYFMNKIKYSNVDFNFKYLMSPLNINQEYGDIIFEWKYLNIKLLFNSYCIELYYKNKNFKNYLIGNGKNEFITLINDLNMLCN